MMIRYNGTLDDLVALNRHCTASVPSFRRRRALNIWGIPVFLLMASLYLALQSEWFWTSYIAFFATFIHMWTRYKFGRGFDNNIRKLYGSGKNAYLLGEHTLEIVEDGLLARSSVSEGKVLWAGIERIVPTETHTFIQLGEAVAFVLNKNAILEGNYDEFVRTLQERLAAAQSAATTPTLTATN